MPRNELKAVLFDMDGVLVDVSGSYRRAIEETAAHFTGRDILPGAVQRYKNSGGYNDDWKLTHAMIRDLGCSVTMRRVVDEFQRRYRGDNWNGLITQEPILIDEKTLASLEREGYTMGIVTGRPLAEAEWTLSRMGTAKYFPLIIAMEHQDGRGKPDPYPLQRALSMLAAAGRSIDPRQTVYVGDSVDDMRAARSAGMWALGVVPPGLDESEHTSVLREAGAHSVTTSTSNIPRSVKRISKKLEEDR